jgi:hypothetical protein
MTASTARPPRTAAAGPRALLATSWWLVRRRPLLVPLAAAGVLVLGAMPVLDDGYALQVLRGVSVLLACALAATTDDPSGEVAAASPYPRSVRTAARVLAGAAVVLPTWLAAAAVVKSQAPQIPVLGLGVEALTLGAVAVAIGNGLRAWRGQHAPSLLAALGLVGFAFGTAVAPRWYALQQGQTWGPPWEAAQFRWWGLALITFGIALHALRDPLAGIGDESSEVRPWQEGATPAVRRIRA